MKKIYFLLFSLFLFGCKKTYQVQVIPSDAKCGYIRIEKPSGYESVQGSGGIISIKEGEKVRSSISYFDGITDDFAVYYTDVQDVQDSKYIHYYSKGSVVEFTIK
ncbi:MAG: hypothetical protein KJ941_03625 [Bacteroidetes bacterium]|nr:hypothetical protein [Bacteroidota bacterium]